MILHRLVLLIGIGSAVVFACTPEGKKSSDDDDGSGSGGSGGMGTGGSSTGSGQTKACEDTCIPQFPAGELNYRNLRECLFCHACADVCVEEGAEICVKGIAEGGCSIQFQNCADCINSACAFEQLPDTTFMGVCAGNADACAHDVQCVALNNCVASCVQGASGAGGAATSTGASSTMTSTGSL